MTSIKSEKLISVVAPFHNNSNYLSQFVENWKKILDFQGEFVEVILVDDHSTDDFENVLSGSDLSGIKIVHNTGAGGAGDARNFGLRCAEGNYIYFVDVDDLVDVQSFGKLVHHVGKSNNNSVDVYHFGFYFTKDHQENPFYSSQNVVSGNFKIQDAADYIHTLFANGSPYVVWNKLYRREFIDESNVNFTLNRVAQDAIFNLRLLPQAKSIDIVDLNVYKYLVGRPNSNSNVNKSKFNDEKQVVSLLASLLLPKYRDIVSSETVRVSINELKYLVMSGRFEHDSKSLTDFVDEMNPFGTKAMILKMILKHSSLRIAFASFMKLRSKGQ